MSTNTIEAEKTPDTSAPQAKSKRTIAKKAKQGKKAGGANRASGAKSDRTNKKAEVIAMMKRAKGATLAEIMEATGWQAHTVRGFVSILGSKGGEKIESSKSADGERTYKIAK
jgi:DNA invertase Pin-like site-specific DNA recombinase